MAEIKTIHVDISKIVEYANKISTLGTDLNTAKTALVQAMKDVKEGWQGQGADRFDELVADDWAVAVERYCELIDLLVDIMNEAASTYQTMQDNINALQYSK